MRDPEPCRIKHTEDSFEAQMMEKAELDPGGPEVSY